MLMVSWAFDVEFIYLVHFVLLPRSSINLSLSYIMFIQVTLLIHKEKENQQCLIPHRSKKKFSRAHGNLDSAATGMWCVQIKTRQY